ncbi:MAG: protein phosphatase 2C domain-containing protein [Bacteroidota bacterium]
MDKSQKVQENIVLPQIPFGETSLPEQMEDQSPTPQEKVPINNNVEFKLSRSIVQGHSHKKSTPPIPCQDYGRAGVLSNGYHVIIVSDGAGSSRLSHVASEFCVNTLYSYLQVFDFKDFSSIDEPSDKIELKWNEAVANLFGRTRTALLNLSRENDLPTADLNCTLLMIIRTEWGFLSANIGDGRAGASNGKGYSLTVPLQTFTAGATFFLIKDGWEKIFRAYITPVKDSEKIKYFFACTDGCQDFVMDWSEKGPRNGIYDNVLGEEARYDYNVPYEPFFDGLIDSLNEVATEHERNHRLERLIENGIHTYKGKEKVLETLIDPLLDDDKTLIIFHK